MKTSLTNGNSAQPDIHITEFCFGFREFSDAANFWRHTVSIIGPLRDSLIGEHPLAAENPSIDVAQLNRWRQFGYVFDMSTFVWCLKSVIRELTPTSGRPKPTLASFQNCGFSYETDLRRAKITLEYSKETGWRVHGWVKLMKPWLVQDALRAAAKNPQHKVRFSRVELQRTLAA